MLLARSMRHGRHGVQKNLHRGHLPSNHSRARGCLRDAGRRGRFAVAQGLALQRHQANPALRRRERSSRALRGPARPAQSHHPPRQALPRRETRAQVCASSGREAERGPEADLGCAQRRRVRFRRLRHCHLADVDSRLKRRLPRCAERRCHQGIRASALGRHLGSTGHDELQRAVHPPSACRHLYGLGVPV